MYPEPEAVGNGGTSAPSEEKTGQETPKEDFSFDVSGAVEEEEPSPDELPSEEPAGEYKLELGELPPEAAPYVEMFTAEARAAGIDASKASAFVRSFTEKMQVLEKEIEAKERADSVGSLKKEWGSAFESNYKKTQDFMQKLFTKARLSPEERAFFGNPTGFLLMNKLMGAIGNRSFVQGANIPAKSKQERINELIAQHAKINNSPNRDVVEMKNIRRKINEIAGVTLFSL